MEALRAIQDWSQRATSTACRTSGGPATATQPGTETASAGMVATQTPQKYSVSASAAAKRRLSVFARRLLRISDVSDTISPAKRDKLKGSGNPPAFHSDQSVVPSCLNAPRRKTCSNGAPTGRSIAVQECP